MKPFMKQAGLLVLAFSIAMGCSKDDKKQPSNTPEEQSTLELSAANITAESLYNDVFSEVIIANTDEGLTQPSQPGQMFGCATVTVDPADPGVYPKTVTIDYGADGCTFEGITRKGKIVYSITDQFRNPGAYISVSFQNYSVNDYKLEGVFSISNNTSGTDISIATQTTSGKLTYPSGKYYTYEGGHVWNLTAGAGTATIADDEYTIHGDGNLASSLGDSLATSINVGLLRKLSCANIVSGTVDITYNDIHGLLDFGTGDCNKDVTLTLLNGKVFQLTLP